MCAQSSSSRLLGEVSALSSEEGAASLEGGPQRLRDIVAKAVFKLCFVLSKQWSQSPPSVAPLTVRPPSIGQIDVNSADATNMSYRELRRNRGTQRAVTDVAQLLSKYCQYSASIASLTTFLLYLTCLSLYEGMIANIISMLTAEDSAHTSPGMSGVIDETTVLCSSAILSLSKVKQGRQSFVTHGLLALVTRWLEESKFILAEAFNKETPSIPLPEDHLVHKLINNVCGILVAVVSASSAQTGISGYSEM